MNQSEQARAAAPFWRNLVETANPSWFVHVNPLTPEGSLMQHDVRIYVMDTSTGFLLAGCVDTAGLVRLAARVNASQAERGRIVEEAPAMMMERLAEQPDAASPKGQEVITMALCALTQTQTFSVVQHQFGRLAGHWFYMLYRFRDTGAGGMCRPAFVPAKTTGFMATEQCHDVAQRALRGDIGAANGVGSQIAEGKGLVLASSYRTVLRHPGL